MPKAARQGLRIVTRPGTSSLYLRGSVRGIRVYESVGTDDPVLAEEARSTRETELYRAALHGTPQPRVTFAAAALSYMEVNPPGPAMQAALGKLIRLAGPALTCDDADQAFCDRAARAALRPGAKPATRLRQIITPVRAVRSHAARRGWCAPPLFEPVKSSPPRTEWLTPAEAERLIAAAEKRVRPLLEFLFCTGARLGEALQLDWRDVDLAHGRALLRETKSGTDRIAALPSRAVAALANLKDHDGPVFRARAGRAYRLTDDGKRVPFGGQIRASWGRALGVAGIAKKVTPHHARHSWASWHYAVHRDLLLLKADGCWASVSQVERYAKLVPKGLVPSIRAFWGAATNPVQVIENREAM